MYLLLLCTSNGHSKSDAAQAIRRDYDRHCAWPAQLSSKPCWVKLPPVFHPDKEGAVLEIIKDEESFNDGDAAQKIREYYGHDIVILNEFNKNPFTFIRNGLPEYCGNFMHILDAEEFIFQPSFREYYLNGISPKKRDEILSKLERVCKLQPFMPVGSYQVSDK